MTNSGNYSGLGSKEQSIVVIAHDVDNGGSVGSVAWNHVQVLAQDYRVYVISQGVPVTENPNINPKLVRSRKWNALRRFAHVPNELSFLREARKELAQLSDKIDLKAIWCHSHGATSICAIPIAQEKKISVIMTTHGDIFERPPGTYDFFLTLFYKWVTKKAYRQADRVQALSPYMAELAVKNGAVDGAVRTIPNGICPREVGLSKILHRDKATFAGNTLKLLFVGNLLPIKGVRHLIKALKIAQSRSDKSISLKCVGDGPEKASLIKLVSELNLESSVDFVGKVPKKRISDYYSAADALCVPSDSDSLPTVVLEAFAHGLPVLGAAIGGISYMTSENRGVLFEPGNAGELAQVMINLADNRSQLSRFSKECSAAAEGEFSWGTVGDELTAMLAECIAQKSRPELQL